ncbi:MAG: hypothetical protein IT204_01580 [Fimbriimonadaceae bacterium]|nr:hypothetical protein [Fimbriimonadaceae bacterium]
MARIWRCCAVTLLHLLCAGLLGCGGGGTPATADPSTEVLAGSGPVADAADAATRVLRQYVGLAAARQNEPRYGTGDDPAIGVFSLQDTPLPRGAHLRAFFEDQDYILNDSFYTFFADLNLLANFEHLGALLFVRPSDGAIFVRSVRSWPVLDGEDRLLAEADRLANLVYIHGDFADLLEPEDERTRLPLAGSAAGALIVCSEEARRQGDIDNTAEYLQELTGQANPLSVLWDRHPDRFGRAEFAARLRSTSTGLGANDKYFLVLATHGSAPPNSRVQIGRDRLTYEELCQLLNENVTAGHINIFNAACYGGNMVPVFDQWDAQTDKAVHWFTDSDATHPSYSAPDTIGLKCALMQMQEALELANADGVVTLAEVEAGMAGLELTADEIIEKICEAAGLTPEDPEPAWKTDMERDDPGNDRWPRPGEPKRGGFSGAPPPVPLFVLDLIERLRLARLAGDPILLGPLYDPRYNYNGSTHQEMTHPSNDLVITTQTVDSIARHGDGFRFSGHRRLTADNVVPILSDQQFTRWLEILPVGDSGQITAERLVEWTQFDRGGSAYHGLAQPAAPQLGNVLVGGTRVDSFFDVFTELSLGGASTLTVSADANFAARQQPQLGAYAGRVFATLGGVTTTMARQGSSATYSGQVSLPTVPGRWVLSLSASDRAEDANGGFVSISTGRSLEIVVTP